jgi:hypothetical protein
MPLKAFRFGELNGWTHHRVWPLIFNSEKEIEKFYAAKSSSYFYITADINLGEYQIITKLANKDTNIAVEDKNFDDLDNLDENSDEKLIKIIKSDEE